MAGKANAARMALFSVILKRVPRVINNDVTPLFLFTALFLLSRSRVIKLITH